MAAGQARGQHGRQASPGVELEGFRAALAGENGSGKSTLVKILSGRGACPGLGPRARSIIIIYEVAGQTPGHLVFCARLALRQQAEGEPGAVPGQDSGVKHRPATSEHQANDIRSTLLGQRRTAVRAGRARLRALPGSGDHPEDPDVREPAPRVQQAAGGGLRRGVQLLVRLPPQRDPRSAGPRVRAPLPAADREGRVDAPPVTVTCRPTRSGATRGTSCASWTRRWPPAG